MKEIKGNDRSKHEFIKYQWNDESTYRTKII